LIPEDDLDFSRDFNARIGALCARLQQSDWGVFYGGYELLQPLAGPDAEIQSMAAEAAVRTTHFVAFQAPVMERAAAYLQAMLARPGGHPDGGPMHVDGAYSWFRRQHPEMLTLIAVPELGYQRSSKTDIHPLSWIDRTPLLRDAANLARKLKNHLRSSRA
ncbi:MAG: LPS biosynthesis glycosyltransferase, partial [Betaproteobacteria bacterium]|nr:LPS biosynthesis glycosyltransferase [Betaproteobacteria bacterium]